MLGEYELLEAWGKGATATVWKAEHQPTGALCALKVLHADLRLQDLAVRQFRREVRAVAALDHPHIARIFDQGTVGDDTPDRKHIAPGSPFLVFEALPGGHLGEHRGTLPWDRLRVVVGDLLGGLAHAHARGVLHRDLKPNNVLFDAPVISPDARAVLTDFGIARVLNRRADREETDLGMGLDYLGTPHYSSREQIVGPLTDVGPWSDLYSLGALVWSMVCGQAPFQGDSSVEILRQHVLGELPAFEPLIPVPDALEDWLMRSMSRGIETRFLRAADARLAWNALDPAAPPPPRTVRRRPELARGSGLFGLREGALVGRDAETAQLDDALEGVVQAGGVRIVVLRGPAGTGKSRLARALCERASEAGIADVLAAPHAPTRSARSGLSAALERTLRTVDLPVEEVRARLRARLETYGLDPGLEPILLEALRPGTLEQAPNARAQRAAIRSLLAALSRRKPILLWLDDLQWAPDTARLLLKLDREDANILVVTTVPSEQLRPGSPLANLLGQLVDSGPHLELAVGPLTRDQTSALVSELLFVDPALADELARRSGGNPLYARELTASLLERGALHETDSGLVLQKNADLSLPGDLRRLWLDRIDLVLRGMTEPRLALEAAAALGARVELTEWQAACAALSIPTPHFLPGQLAEHGVVVEHVYDFRFAHVLAREALEDRAREAGRWPAVCSACADALATSSQPAIDERRARLLQEAGRPAEAFEPALAAAARAQSSGRHDDAAAWIDVAERALKDARVGSEDPRHVVLQLAVAQGLRLQSDYPAACRAAERATLLALERDDPALTAKALVLQGVLTRMVGRTGEGIALLREAVAAYEDLDKPTAQAQALASLGQALATQTGHEEEVDALYDRAWSLLGDRPEPLTRGRLARLMAAEARRGGRLAEARDLLDSALRTSQRSGRLHDEARVRHDLGVVLRALEQLEPAERHARAMLTLALRMEHGGDESDAWTLLGEILLAQGRTTEAEEAFGRSVEIARERRSPWLPFAVTNLCAVYLRSGRHALAAQRLAEVGGAIEGRGVPAYLAYLRTLQLLADLGTPGGGTARLDELEAMDPLRAADGPLLRELLAEAALKASDPGLSARLGALIRRLEDG